LQKLINNLFVILKTIITIIMEPEKKSNGALIGLIVIIIILVVGGLYIWQSNMSPSQTTSENISGSTTISKQDAEELDRLEADSRTTDSNTGVDANALY